VRGAGIFKIPPPERVLKKRDIFPYKSDPLRHEQNEASRLAL